MADISKIKVGATTYNIKDSTVRSDYLKSTADTGSGHHNLLSTGGWRSFSGSNTSSPGIALIASSTPRLGLYVYNSSTSGSGWLIHENENGSLNIGEYLNSNYNMNIRTGSNKGAIYANGAPLSSNRTAHDYGVVWGLNAESTGYPNIVGIQNFFPGVSGSRTTSLSYSASAKHSLVTLTLPKKGVYIATGTCNTSGLGSNFGLSISNTAGELGTVRQTASGSSVNIAWITDVHNKNDKLYLVGYTNSNGSGSVTNAYFRAVWIGSAIT